MVYLLYVKASFSTANKRDNALAQVTNYLAQPGIAGDAFVPSQVAPYDGGYKGWPNAMTVQCRFRTQVTRDDLWTTLDSFLATSTRAPDQSLGERWDQALDAAAPDADTTRYNYLTKTWP